MISLDPGILGTQLECADSTSETIVDDRANGLPVLM